MLIHLNDTPNGSDTYAFQVVLNEKLPPVQSPEATLHVRAAIDGSDRLVITNTEATWQHNHWATPNDVQLNGIEWNPSVENSLSNSGTTQFLLDGVDLSTAAFTKNAGRDLATFEVFDDRIEVVFADNPNGADWYDVTIEFGSVPEPSTVTLLVVGAIGLLAFAWRKNKQV